MKEGEILKEENDKKIESIGNTSTKEYFIHQKKVYHIRKVNSIKDRSLTSDVGNYLCVKYPDIDFAIITSRGLNYWSYSLRGMKGKCHNLSSIAKTYGGGGHPSSSGMRIYDNDERLYFSPLTKN